MWRWGAAARNEQRAHHRPRAPLPPLRHRYHPPPRAPPPVALQRHSNPPPGLPQAGVAECVIAAAASLRFDAPAVLARVATCGGCSNFHNFNDRLLRCTPPQTHPPAEATCAAPSPRTTRCQSAPPQTSQTPPACARLTPQRALRGVAGGCSCGEGWGAGAAVRDAKRVRGARRSDLPPQVFARTKLTNL